MSQIARPAVDGSITSMVFSPDPGSGNRYQNLDDAITETGTGAGDGNFCRSNFSGNGATGQHLFAVKLSSLNDPQVHTGHKLRAYVGKQAPTGTGQIIVSRVDLYQGNPDSGGTFIVQIFTSNGGETAREVTLTETQAGNITNYADLWLYVRIESQNNPDILDRAARNGACSWAMLVVPDAAPAVSGTMAISGGGALNTSARKAVSSTVSVSGGGTAATVASKNISTTMAVSGGGAVNTVGNKQASSTMSVPGGGSISTIGIKQGSSGILISGGGSVAGVGFKGALSGVSVTGGGLVTITPLGPPPPALTISGGGSVTIVGRKNATSQVTVSARTRLVVVARKAVSSSMALSTTGNLRFSILPTEEEDKPNVVAPLLPHIPKRYLIYIKQNRVIRTARK